MLALFLAALDQTIVATALPTIGRALGDLESLPWVITAYLVAATAVTPLYGKFSDIHGRRAALLIGISVFVVGSLACALAPSMAALVVGRALQGLGGGGLIALAQTVLADVAAPRERGKYQAYFASVFAASSIAGPVLGGVIAEHLHWSVIFWINLPLGLAALAMTYSALRRLPRHERPHRLDVPGALLLGLASLTLLLALSWGGVRYPWTSPTLLGLAAVSALVWALFVLRLARAAEPLIPLDVLRSGVVRAGTASACFGMGSFIALVVYLPIYFESARGLSASQSGLALIPLTVGTVSGATVAGRALSKVEHYKRLPLIGLAVATAGCLLLAAAAGAMPLAAILLVTVAISAGLGTLLPVSTVAIQNAVAPHQMGTTTATANFFRQIGGALMVAIFGAILLGGAAGPAVLHPEILAASPADQAAMAATFRWIFVAAALGLALALLALATMEEAPLRGSSGAGGAEAV